MNALQRITRLQRPTLVRGISSLAIGAAGATTLGAGSYWFATKRQKFFELNDPNDGLLRSKYYANWNPHGNEDLSDIYQARVPLSEVRPDLVSDFKRGGSKLIERYCSGLLGGWGFAIQRRLSIRHAKHAETTNPDELYTKAQIMDSTFEQGTGISNHFTVVEKTPTSILFRGGSPSDENGLRTVDSLMQGVVDIDEKQEVAILRLKCMFYSGQVKGSPPPLPKAMMPLHLIYAKALAANGTANCRR